MANVGVFISILKSIKEQAWDEEGAKIDNVAQRLNYQVTTCLLLLFSSLLAFHNWFGLGDRPIECIIAKKDSDTLAHFEQYCWMQPMNISMEEDKWDVDNFKMHKEGFGKIGKDDRFFTFTYYQWCAFFFLLQAACFTAPRLIWKGLEEGHMDDLVKAVDREEYARKENKLKVGQAGGDAAARWLESRKLRGVNSTYAGASVICEFLYGLNIFVQWWMVDAFLGRAPIGHWEDGDFGQVDPGATVNFLNLGTHMMTSDRPLLNINILFPKQINCIWKTFGAGGDADEQDGICLLPLNVIQDKLFLCLWFWLVGISIVTGASLIYRTVMLTSPYCRRWKLEHEVLSSKADKGTVEAKVEAKTRRQAIKKVASSHADFFVFESFRRNCPALVVKSAILKLKNKKQ